MHSWPLYTCSFAWLTDVVRPRQTSLSGSDSQVTDLACRELATRFPLLVSFPGDELYEHEQRSYWSSRQSDIQPGCRVTPRNALETSSLVNYLYRHELNFAIVSGGHSTAVAASNVEAGITLDLSLLSSVDIDLERCLVSVGTGARWNDVYQLLDRDCITVVGARAGTVGVGGFLLGGGISLLATKHGWSCNSIDSMEVVLANGTQITTNDVYHTDLFRSLKGGGSNFGIPTSFVLRTVPFEQLQVAIVRYDGDQIQELLPLLSACVHNADTNLDSSFELSLTVDPSAGTVSAFLMFTRYGDVRNASGLQRLLSVPHGHVVIKSVSPFELAREVELSNPGGFRQHKATMTIQNDAATALEIAQQFEAAVTDLRLANDPGYRPGMIIQPISNAQLMSDSGNSLGFNDEEYPLLLLSFEIRWSDESADALYVEPVDNLLSCCQKIAEDRGKLHPYTYLNYAAAYQDPFAQLRNTELLEELRRVRAKYDAESYLEKHLLRPFKL